MDSMLVRLKRYDPRRGHVLRRFTYAGVKVHEERGWYRVTKPIADYLRSVRQVAGDEYSPLAFDVCTDDEAKAQDAKDEVETKVRRTATDDLKLSVERGEQPSASNQPAGKPKGKS